MVVTPYVHLSALSTRPPRYLGGPSAPTPGRGLPPYVSVHDALPLDLDAARRTPLPQRPARPPGASDAFTAAGGHRADAGEELVSAIRNLNASCMCVGRVV